MTGGYGAELSAAWAEHLAPRAPDAPTVVSLFAGCGGSSLGYSMAGYRELLAVEWDDHAAATFALNFPAVPLHHGDIAAVDPAILDLPAGTLDVLDGSPPCQGFSTTGKRRMDDPRNDLFREYVRLLGAWSPRAFVMENVAGLVRGHARLKFAEMLAALKSAGPGYRVSVRLLDASFFRVPQRRERLIFVGLRDDLNAEPQHPAPTGRPPTVRDAWVGLADPGYVRPVPPASKAALLRGILVPGQNGASALKAAGRKGSYYSISRLAWDRPANTLTTSADRATYLLHPSGTRGIGPFEAARLQSFPDEYRWGDSTFIQIFKRVGNSVPPLMMRAIARTVRRTLDMSPSVVL